MKILESTRARLILAAALALGLGRPARASITLTWTSTTSISDTGVGQDVALDPADDAVYAAGTRAGNFYVGKFNASDGSINVEFSTSTGYGLGVGVGPSGQVGVIGGVLTNSTTGYMIAILDQIMLQPVSANWPIYVPGYYDFGASSTTNLSGASTTTYRASAVFDTSGNIYVGFNTSSTTAVIREYNSAATQVGSDITFSSNPYLYFEQLAIDTSTTPNYLYSIMEGAQVQINAYKVTGAGLAAYAGPYYDPWVGTDVGRRQSITAGANQIIAGGQRYDVQASTNPFNTWAQQFNISLSLLTSEEDQNPASVGGNSSFGLAQRPPLCGAFYSVGDSTGIWVGLYGLNGTLDYAGVDYYDKSASGAFRGNAITADPSRDVYITGTTKSNASFFVKRLQDNSCGNNVPPPPQPCTVTPSAFPNPFKVGKDTVRIQYYLLPAVVEQGSGDPTVTLEIYYPSGGLAKSFSSTLVSTQLNTITWNGLDAQGKPMPPGNYDATLEIATSPTASPPGPICRSLIRMGGR